MTSPAAQEVAIEDVIAKIREVLGDHATAYIGDFKSVDKLVPPVKVAGQKRLRDTYAIIELLEPVEAHSTIRAWFFGLNPVLGDRSPGVVIKESYAQVKKAAEEFLANG